MAGGGDDGRHAEGTHGGGMPGSQSMAFASAAAQVTGKEDGRMARAYVTARPVAPAAGAGAAVCGRASVAGLTPVRVVEQLGPHHEGGRLLHGRRDALGVVVGVEGAELGFVVRARDALDRFGRHFFGFRAARYVRSMVPPMLRLLCVTFHAK